MFIYAICFTCGDAKEKASRSPSTSHPVRVSCYAPCRKTYPNSNTPARKSRLTKIASWRTFNNGCPEHNWRCKWPSSIATSQASAGALQLGCRADEPAGAQRRLTPPCLCRLSRVNRTSGTRILQPRLLLWPIQAFPRNIATDIGVASSVTISRVERIDSSNRRRSRHNLRFSHSLRFPVSPAVLDSPRLAGL